MNATSRTSRRGALGRIHPVADVCKMLLRVSREVFPKNNLQVAGRIGETCEFSERYAQFASFDEEPRQLAVCEPWAVGDVEDLLPEVRVSEDDHAAAGSRKELKPLLAMQPVVQTHERFVVERRPKLSAVILQIWEVVQQVVVAGVTSQQDHFLSTCRIGISNWKFRVFDTIISSLNNQYAYATYTL